MGLVYIRLDGRAYNLGITNKGGEIANEIIKEKTYDDIIERARIIKRNFNISGTNLMKFIYKTFPEIGTLQLGEEI